MPTRQRVDAYRALFGLARATERSPAETWAPDFTRVRVRLGTGLADYALPYSLHEDLQRALDSALLGLAFLYLRRHAALLGEDADRILLEDPGQSALRPLSYSAPEGVQHSALRECLEEAPEILSDLDTGILASWLGSGGSGRKWMGLWTRVLHACFDEAARSETREPTPLLFSWVVLRACGEAIERMPWRRRLPAPLRERADAALRVGLYQLHRIVRQLLAEERGAALEPGSEAAVAWDALLNPALHFAGAPEALARCRFHPVSPELLGAAAHSLCDALPGLPSFDACARSVSELLESEPALRSRAQQAYALAQMRRDQLAVLALGVSRHSRLHAEIAAWLEDPARFAALLADPAARAETGKLLAPLLREPQSGPLQPRAAALARFIESYAAERPLAALPIDAARADAEIAASLAAAILDGHFAQQGSALLGRFRPLTGQETDRDLAQQYDAGRIYLFGAAPILKQRASGAQLGHYFIDLKDFTRRTALLKEEVMADFIREHFYLPILSLAREYHHGLPEMQDRGGVHLNNLLGDAISISGDVASLVQIAHRIRRHLAAYAALLKARESDEDLARRAEQLRSRCAARMRDLQEEQQRLEQAAAPSARRLAELHREQQRLEGEIERELAALTGAELCAGSFIAFGAAATVLAFDDPTWGGQRVSIGEKINESARGTERSAGVRRIADADLEAERLRAGAPDLEPAFQVHVRRPLSLALPLELEQRAHEALSAGDFRAAERAFADAVGRQLGELESAGESALREHLQQGMSLYNAGDALSADALDAYRKAANLAHVEATIPLEELEPELRGRFALGAEPLRLVLCTDESGGVSEIFRHAGALTFKGFEAAPPTGVWEMLDLESDLGQSLAWSARVRAALG